MIGLAVPIRHVSMTTVVGPGSPLHGIVNSNVWDQTTLVAGARARGFDGPVTKFRGNSLVIPQGRTLLSGNA